MMLPSFSEIRSRGDNPANPAMAAVLTSPFCVLPAKPPEQVTYRQLSFGW
jgi:hypothetical protein